MVTITLKTPITLRYKSFPDAPAVPWKANVIRAKERPNTPPRVTDHVWLEVVQVAGMDNEAKFYDFHEVASVTVLWSNVLSIQGDTDREVKQ